MIRLFLLILLIGFASALDVELDCPSDVYVGENFTCEVQVEDGEAKYDLKLEIDEERDSALRVWDNGWKSSYYYLNDFVRKDKDVVLMFEESGKYWITVKLRDGSSVEEFDASKIKVLGERREFSLNLSEKNDSGILINLGEDIDENKKDEWEYVSRDGVVVDWLPYAFCVFLIGLLGIMMVEKFWN